jgi:hypothetical protein
MANTTEEDKTTTHGCIATAKWGWTIDADTGRWSNPQQAIKPMRYRIPTDPDDPNNDGFGVKHSKLKIRGHGTSLVVRFESEEGKDFQILGWSIPFTAETTP